MKVLVVVWMLIMTSVVSCMATVMWLDRPENVTTVEKTFQALK